MRKVDVLEYWQGVSVASASCHFDLPAVMCVRGYVQRPRKRNNTIISRRNILIRDQYMCQCVPAAAYHWRVPGSTMATARGSDL